MTIQQYLKKITHKVQKTNFISPSSRTYLKAYYQGLKYRKIFKDINTYCLFVGYQRSGHSLVSAILDAHPSIIIANELNSLKYFKLGWSKRQIYYLLLQNSQKFAAKGQNWFGYSYKVSCQWQGRFQSLKIIGDKKGALSTIELSSNPKLFRTMQDILNIPVKFIHVYRNPYDNITTMFKRKDWKHRKVFDLEGTINCYFELSKNVDFLKQMIPSQDFFDLRHETLIDRPREAIRELCCFLGVEPTDDYLDDCANIVFKSPHKSRESVQWNDELIELVSKRIDEFPFLKGYTYED